MKCDNLKDSFGSKQTITIADKEVTFYSLKKLEEAGIANISKLPYSIRVLLEDILRNVDGKVITEDDVKNLASWSPDGVLAVDIPFIPSRVLMQDFTGVPAVVDIAAIRSAMERLGGDPSAINPVIPANLVIDHSIQVDYYGTSYARNCNEKYEFHRNKERYELLHWAQNAFDNLKVVPPASGIIHQVNLEYLASVVHLNEKCGELIAYPDTLVGTDSHTTMINGLGVLGWGVGGIEAEAVMLGQPYYMPIPEVVGFKLTGELREGVSATDLVLTVVQMLREHGVVGKFVEFYGPGYKAIELTERAVLANMAPEYGATMGFCPVDEVTLAYMTMTGRTEEQVELVRQYCKEQGLFLENDAPEPEFTSTLELDISTVEPSLAGPKRPQDRIPIPEMSRAFHQTMKEVFAAKSGKEACETDPDYGRWLNEGGYSVSEITHPHHTGITKIKCAEDVVSVTHGSVVIASITSCTNTSSPALMIGAGLLAKKAVEKGLKVKPFVKTSLAPGSRVVTDYLEEAGLMPYLDALGFHLVGYGCLTCIGNSGPLREAVSNEIEDKDLTVAAVLSGNRNFEGRINSQIKANYLASPMLVVAYALAGTVDIDLMNEPIACDPNGQPVYLKDIWPGKEELNECMQGAVTPEMFKEQYSNVYEGTELWRELDAPKGLLYDWDADSTYIQEPPFFKDFPLEVESLADIKSAKALAYVGDSITTDHISPAGSIPTSYPAGQYLIAKGVDEKNFNSYGSRRGNHEVMMRGTFGNVRLKNKLVGKEGSWTMYLPENKEMPIYDAAMKYIEQKIPLIVVAGKEYGTGSSRDWAAKGTQLLGIKAVIAESFERIHRSNLVGMGVLPLQFKEGESAETLGLTGTETYDITGIEELKPFGELTVVAKSDDGEEKSFMVDVRLNSEIEIEYYMNGGILHKFLRDRVKGE
ncbi:MAG: aconitate hydratase [Methanolobus sp.]|jgi:aconitate hydratase|uniref:aconitate hydratase AcnA n=1 Tax=Methanolobus sp. TaxID=1874737 RepID=UPI00258B80F3|nr:aconitate hydratase AcnA [Methanolobus sp.]MDK2831195.1 aconitate hydratase [Methanolobus sp.]MDK2939979.1 aconitate hydratase [Methanolobus sp.]